MAGFDRGVVVNVPDMLLFLLSFLSQHLSLECRYHTISHIMFIKPPQMFPLNSEVSSQIFLSFDPFILQSFVDSSPVRLATNRHTPLSSEVDLPLAPTTSAP